MNKCFGGMYVFQKMILVIKIGLFKSSGKLEMALFWIVSEFACLQVN